MRSQNTFAILFWVARNRVKHGYASVYARITVESQRVNFSIQRKVKLTDWDSAKGKARGNSQESRHLNRYIEQIRSSIFLAYEELRKEKELITAENIKARYLQLDKEEYTLLELIDYHNEKMSETLRYGTLKNYHTTLRYIKKFLKEDQKKEDIYLSKLTYKFVVDFEKYLRAHKPTDHQKPMGNNTVMKHIQRLRKMVTLAYKMEWIEKDPFIRFKPSYVKFDREYLNEYELQAVEDRDFRIDRLQTVKQLFVFSCYTGLSYSDVMNLTTDNIQLGIDGNKWIVTSRQKTDKSVRIPLLEKALDIIEYFSDHEKTIGTDKLFPSMTNQKLNSYLKEIADVNGINKKLTFHVARHTFAYGYFVKWCPNRDSLKTSWAHQAGNYSNLCSSNRDQG